MTNKLAMTNENALKAFFDAARPTVFRGKINAGQVIGVKEILEACGRHGVTDQEEIAYILATAYWETARTMRPIREYGRGRGRKYGRKHPKTGQTYYGRGYVQLTWHFNYKKMGDLLGVDLVNNPDLAMDRRYAADILVIGMKNGLFAPAAGPLSKYLGKAENWLGARRTVNGTDHAAKFAKTARQFDAALEKAWTYFHVDPDMPSIRPRIEGTPSTHETPPSKFKPTLMGLLGSIIKLIIERIV